MALGASLQNIVTQKEEDAKKLVEHLRKNNLGRATFLPIASISGKKLDKLDDKGIEGVIGIASDLIKTDKKYENIIISLLGRTVIVDDMEHAIELAKQNHYTFKIVTLKGDIINSYRRYYRRIYTDKNVKHIRKSKRDRRIRKNAKTNPKTNRTRTKTKNGLYQKYRRGIKPSRYFRRKAKTNRHYLCN